MKNYDSRFTDLIEKQMSQGNEGMTSTLTNDVVNSADIPLFLDMSVMVLI